MTKMLSASRGLCPPDPLTRGSAPDTRYRLVLRTRHGAPQPLTPSAAYAAGALSARDVAVTLVPVLRSRHVVIEHDVSHKTGIKKHIATAPNED